MPCCYHKRFVHVFRMAPLASYAHTIRPTARMLVFNTLLQNLSLYYYIQSCIVSHHSSHNFLEYFHHCWCHCLQNNPRFGGEQGPRVGGWSRAFYFWSMLLQTTTFDAEPAWPQHLILPLLNRTDKKSLQGTLLESFSRLKMVYILGTRYSLHHIFAERILF